MRNVDIASILLRAALAITMFAHGWNHAFRGGKLAGTGRWFESIGIRPGRVHALLATLTELGVAPLLALGLLTPLAAAGVLGVMVVALIANHLKNGYFIFRPGEGYEYVLFITLTALALGALGGGGWSLDRLLADHSSDLARWLAGWRGLGVTALAGGGGAGLLLVTCWRPNRTG
ncbi:MAG: putative oxidoreductase [Frankiaceae bacterium]|jgi:putative oxidoreductase|nr:putative oxidoreductase [Frankiaceae bacterium]